MKSLSRALLLFSDLAVLDPLKLDGLIASNVIHIWSNNYGNRSRGNLARGANLGTKGSPELSR